MESSVKVGTKPANGHKATKAKKNKGAARTVIILLITVIVVLVAAFFIYQYVIERNEELRQSIINSGTFHKGITVNGIAIGGMTPEEAAEALKSAENGVVKNISISLVSGDTAFTATSTDLGIIYNTEEVLGEAMLLGREGSLKELREELADIESNGRAFTLTYTIDPDVLSQYIATLSREFDVNPVNASFKIRELPMSTTKGVNAYDTVNVGLPSDGSVKDLRDLRFEFIEGKNGESIDHDALVNTLMQRIQAEDFSDVEIPLITVPPEITMDILKDKLVLRATASTSYASGSYGRKERVHNMTKATGMIYGTTLLPGQQFSCNETLGYRTLEAGWQPAPAIIDGGAANEDQPGGGVCQVSSTLYQAVLKADYKVDYRQGHSSKLGYVDGGLDATIDSGRIDFTWTNNTESPVYIFMWIDKEKKDIWCELYGEPLSGDFEQIKLLSEELEPIPPTAPEYIPLASLAAPYWKLKNERKTGRVFQTYKAYMKDGKELRRQPIARTTYKMHPDRYYVWIGYDGSPLLPEYQIIDPPAN